MNELKACPFCGGELVKYKPSGCGPSMSILKPLIGCPECRWSVQMNTYAEIEGVVNHRPLEASLKAEVEELREFQEMVRKEFPVKVDESKPDTRAKDVFTKVTKLQREVERLRGLLSVMVSIVIHNAQKAFSLDTPEVGKWVVERSHIVRKGDPRAIGKVISSSMEAVTIETLEGDEQRWVNATFAYINAPYEAQLEIYREALTPQNGKKQ